MRGVGQSIEIVIFEAAAQQGQGNRVVGVDESDEVIGERADGIGVESIGRSQPLQDVERRLGVSLRDPRQIVGTWLSDPIEFGTPPFRRD